MLPPRLNLAHLLRDVSDKAARGSPEDHCNHDWLVRALARALPKLVSVVCDFDSSFDAMSWEGGA